MKDAFETELDRLARVIEGQRHDGWHELTQRRTAIDRVRALHRDQHSRPARRRPPAHRHYVGDDGEPTDDPASAPRPPHLDACGPMDAGGSVEREGETGDITDDLARTAHAQYLMTHRGLPIRKWPEWVREVEAWSSGLQPRLAEWVIEAARTWADSHRQSTPWDRLRQMLDAGERVLFQRRADGRYVAARWDPDIIIWGNASVDLTESLRLLHAGWASDGSAVQEE